MATDDDTVTEARMGGAGRQDGQGRTRRAVAMAATLAAAFAGVLTACGGGKDETDALERSTAAAAEASVGQRDAPVRKSLARPWVRQGVTAIALSPDGSSLAVADADGRLRLLEPAQLGEQKVLRVAGGAATAGLAFSGDGRFLVAARRDSVVQVWQADSGELKLTVKGAAQGLRAVAASADGAWLATGGEDTRVMLWDARSARLQRVLAGAGDFVNGLSLSADGRWLAAGCADGRVLIWSTGNGRLLQTLRGHAGEVNAVAFNADASLLASAGEDGKLILWDRAAGREQQQLGTGGRALRSLAIYGQGTPGVQSAWLASGTADGQVLVWDLASRQLQQQFLAAAGPVEALAFDAAHGERLLMAGERGRLVARGIGRDAAR